MSLLKRLRDAYLVLTAPQLVETRWVKQDLMTGKQTPVEFSDRCWDCGSTEFYEGPSGGLSTNVKCVECGSEFNSNPIEGLCERIRHVPVEKTVV